MTAKGENAKQRRTVYKVVRIDRKSTTLGNVHVLHYPKGVIVEADPESMGIFVFKTRRDAVRHMENCDCNMYSRVFPIYMVLRVEPVGKGCIPKKIRKVWLSHPPLEFTTDVPHGTICYYKVRVLD